MISIFSRGDFRFFWPENISDFATFPSAWDSSLNTGIGKSALGSLWINSYLNFTATFTKLGLSWEAIGLIFWILPSIILSFFSAYYLFKILFPDSKRFGFLAGFIYLTNTYFLMIFTGGQMGVALAYSIAPLVLATFIKLGFRNVILRPEAEESHEILRFAQDDNVMRIIVAGLVLAVQVMFDPRIAYITMIAVVVLAIKKLATLAIPIIIVILLHSYWILPLAITKLSPLPEGFSDISGFEFFSFADFSHAFSLLHPNWPENIFGKIYFLQPEFLLLPIIAYTSLLFIRNSKSEIRNPKQIQNSKFKIQNDYLISQYPNILIFLFAFIGLMGAFLAKGVNPPFGEINIWLFQYFPGMNMFRDPTKFYLLVALSYSVLIPFSVYSIYRWLSAKCKVQSAKLQVKVKSYIPNLFFLFTTTLAWQALLILYLLFLIRPLWLGDLKDKFKPKEIPQEYVQLKDFLVGQPQFFRTLWVPEWQRFGYFSNNHPAVGRYELLKSTTPLGQVEEINKEKTMELLQDLGIKYLIIPYDSGGEIFLEDRKYDSEKRARVEGELDKVPWLTKVRFNDLNHLSRIAVYEIKGSKDRFWSPSTKLGINYSFISPTEYKVEVKNAQKGDLLIFSESFDKNWITTLQQSSGQEFRIQSSEFKDTLNSFVLPKEGNYEFKVFYNPQKWVNIGLVISGVSVLVAVLGFLGLARMKNK